MYFISIALSASSATAFCPGITPPFGCGLRRGVAITRLHGVAAAGGNSGFEGDDRKESEGDGRTEEGEEVTEEEGFVEWAATLEALVAAGSKLTGKPPPVVTTEGNDTLTLTSYETGAWATALITAEVSDEKFLAWGKEQRALLKARELSDQRRDALFRVGFIWDEQAVESMAGFLEMMEA